MLDGIDCSAVPFPHFAVARALPDPVAEGIWRSLRGCTGWHPGRDPSHPVFSLDLNGAEASDVREPLVDREWQAAVRETFAAAWGVRLEGRCRVAVHRMEAGQAIGIHTDAPSEASETHRFVLSLTRGWREPDGGVLVLLDDDRVGGPVAVFPPLFNSAVGMELSPRSRHCVTRVGPAAQRFSVVYSFWRATGTSPWRCSPTPV